MLFLQILSYMEELKFLTIANGGEAAALISRTAKRLNTHTTTIYTEIDAASVPVTAADAAVLLSSGESTAYLDAKQIVEIARSRKVDIIIPGYGFLSKMQDLHSTIPRLKCCSPARVRNLWTSLESNIMREI